MTDDIIEHAARQLCILRGADPYGSVVVPTGPNGSHKFEPMWHVTCEEIKQACLVQAAIDFAHRSAAHRDRKFREPTEHEIRYGTGPFPEPGERQAFRAGYISAQRFDRDAK